MKKLRRYLVRVLIALDQLGNALLGGSEDETISSREGRYDRTQPKTGAPTVTKILDWLDPDHTEGAVEYDPYGRPDPRGLEDRPPGSARLAQHPFDPDPADPPHCGAVLSPGVVCKAPIFHPVHDMPVTA